MNHYVWKLGEGCDRTRRIQTEKKELIDKANDVALQPTMAVNNINEGASKPASLKAIHTSQASKPSSKTTAFKSPLPLTSTILSQLIFLSSALKNSPRS